ncbi:RimK/LysX family protein [Prolixibacteraceae bacterium Z1-6]|uniref:RimK/LysX family protein n=1 Tax=Draconibacterium aestuarii TaxID=2998507 RepID=A0A9X3F8B0_9BACT|nr:RimK/LysX family protein [Prolixibacteraceae bacterium Z1-6]
MNRKRILIGRKDIADFPELGLSGIEVKVDSGAYTSSFHCTHIEKSSNGEKDVIRCVFLDPDHPQYHEKEFSFSDFKIRKVKSSNGMVEERFSVFTQIVIFSKIYRIELTLTERADMKHPVLLGRKFTSKKFLIDTSRKNLSFNNKIIEIEI